MKFQPHNKNDQSHLDICILQDYNTAMGKSEVLTVRIDEALGAKLSLVAQELGITRAEYMRFILSAASHVDPSELKKTWEATLSSRFIQTKQNGD